MFILKKISQENDKNLEMLCDFITKYNELFYNETLKEKDITYLNSFCKVKYIKNEINTNKKQFYFIQNKAKKEIGYAKFEIKEKVLAIKQLYLPDIKKEFIKTIKIFAKENFLDEILIFMPNEKKDDIQELINLGFNDIKEICLFLGNEIFIYGRKLLLNLK